MPPHDPQPDDKVITPVSIDLTPVELDDADLEDIAGGIDIYFSSSMFQSRNRSSSRGRRRRQQQAKDINSSAFQFMGRGFHSSSEIVSVLESLSRFFNR